MSRKLRSKPMHASHDWLCGVTAAYLTFNQVGVGSNPAGAT